MRVYFCECARKRESRQMWVSVNVVKEKPKGNKSGCLFAWECVRAKVRMCVRKRVWVRALCWSDCVPVSACLWMSMCVYVCMDVSVSVYVCMDVTVVLWMYLCIPTNVSLCVSVCLYVWLRVSWPSFHWCLMQTRRRDNGRRRCSAMSQTLS